MKKDVGPTDEYRDADKQSRGYIRIDDSVQIETSNGLRYGVISA